LGEGEGEPCQSSRASGRKGLAWGGNSYSSCVEASGAREKGTLWPSLARSLLLSDSGQAAPWHPLLRGWERKAHLPYAWSKPTGTRRVELGWGWGAVEDGHQKSLGVQLHIWGSLPSESVRPLCRWMAEQQCQDATLRIYLPFAQVSLAKRVLATLEGVILALLAPWSKPLFSQMLSK
jgi:hypothetical protein